MTSYFDIQGLKDSISIADVLREFGVQFRGRRCKCPIHGGSNPTSFAFNRESFYCHSCGARGDTIALIMELSGSGFRESLELAGNMAGQNIRLEPEMQKVTKLKHPKLGSIELFGLKNSLEYAKLMGDIYSRELSLLRKSLKKDTISLDQYYLRQQICDYYLDFYDSEIIRLTHLLKSKKGANLYDA